MKTKFLFIALALPAIFTACSNEEFENEVLQKDGREYLSKDFSIIAEKSIAPMSRGEWNRLESEEGTVSYQFNWINRTAADHIGLCWTGGAMAADSSDVSVANPSNMALSNYDFQLTSYKYLADEDDEELTSETYAAASAAGFATSGNDYRKAEFQVTGVTPLTGEYVMYYPYSADLKNVGYIPTKVNAVQTVATVDSVDQLRKFGNATLCISDPYQFASSDAAANVTLTPYTSGFMPKIFLAEDAEGFVLSRIMIVAKDGKEIINEQTLDLKRNVKTSKGVGAMTVNLPANVKIADSCAVKGGLKVLMAMLPQTLKKDDIEILFVNSQSMAYSYPLSKDLVLKSGELRAPKVTLDPEDFKTYIITDATALQEAINRVSTAAATINTYKNVAITFTSDASFTNAKKATVGAEKIVFEGEVTFGGDIEFTCPVEFKGAVSIASGKTVTLADGTKFSTGASLEMAAGTSDATTTLNLKATEINAALLPTSADKTAINFVSGTSNLNAALTVGEELVVNVKSGAVVNVKVQAALDNGGTVNVEAGATVNVAPYVAANATAGTPEFNPTIVNNKTLVIKGTVNNDNIIDNNGLISTDGAGLINNNKTINNNGTTGKITMYQSSGVVINQATGAVVNDAGSISGVTRISGGEIIAIPATFSDASLALAQYTYHTAFKVTTSTTLTNLNTTKKLILAADVTITNSDEEVTSFASGAIVVAYEATLAANKQLNVTGDVTINANATLIIGDATVVAVSGKVINNGTFQYSNETNSNVTCAGIQTGTGAAWTHYPQWF